MLLKSEQPALTGCGRVERAAKLSLSYYNLSSQAPENEKTLERVSPALDVSWGNNILNGLPADYKGFFPDSTGNTESKSTDSLGNNTTYVSFSRAETPQKRKTTRLKVQQGIANLLPSERVTSCLRLRLPNKLNVEVLYSERQKTSNYGNLVVCGSVWACPVCAVRITEKRRVELAEGLAGWQGGVLMGAFTLQHKRTDSLKDLRKLLADTFRSMQQGHQWKEIMQRFGIIGTVTSTELTWGERAGWHVHKHGLWFTRKEVNEDEIAEIEQVVSKRFRTILAKLGGFGNEDFAVRFTTGKDKAGQADYVTKWGIDAEMTKGAQKMGKDGNLTPFEIAQWWTETGDPQAAALFREYYSAMKGTRQLTFSRGLRKLLALGAEKSDQELAEEQEEDAVVLCELEPVAWKEICSRNLRGELLEVANSGSAEQVAEFLEGLGITDYKVFPRTGAP